MSMTKKRRRHMPEEVIRKLDAGHRQLVAGEEPDEVCRRLDRAESTWHRWLNRYDEMKANDAKQRCRSRHLTPQRTARSTEPIDDSLWDSLG